MAVAGLEDLPGTELAAGTFTISAKENADLAGVLESAAPAGDAAHPLWAYIATQRGIDIGITELCALADFDVNDGPMLGSTKLSYGKPLRVGVEYKVTGEVLDITRKEGNSGTFDIFTFRERLVDPDGEEAASATNTFILPRRAS
jgi:acyl dehydratase